MNTTGTGAETRDHAPPTLTITPPPPPPSSASPGSVHGSQLCEGVRRARMLPWETPSGFFCSAETDTRGLASFISKFSGRKVEPIGQKISRSCVHDHALRSSGPGAAVLIKQSAAEPS